MGHCGKVGRSRTKRRRPGSEVQFFPQIMMACPLGLGSSSLGQLDWAGWSSVHSGTVLREEVLSSFFLFLGRFLKAQSLDTSCGATQAELVLSQSPLLWSLKTEDKLRWGACFALLARGLRQVLTLPAPQSPLPTLRVGGGWGESAHRPGQARGERVRG